jgi:hypothetical protein
MRDILYLQIGLAEPSSCCPDKAEEMHLPREVREARSSAPTRDRTHFTASGSLGSPLRNRARHQTPPASWAAAVRPFQLLISDHLFTYVHMRAIPVSRPPWLSVMASVGTGMARRSEDGNIQQHGPSSRKLVAHYDTV